MVAQVAGCIKFSQILFGKNLNKTKPELETFDPCR